MSSPNMFWFLNKKYINYDIRADGPSAGNSPSIYAFIALKSLFYTSLGAIVSCMMLHAGMFKAECIRYKHIAHNFIHFKKRDFLKAKVTPQETVIHL